MRRHIFWLVGLAIVTAVVWGGSRFEHPVIPRTSAPNSPSPTAAEESGEELSIPPAAPSEVVSSGPAKPAPAPRPVPTLRPPTKRPNEPSPATGEGESGSPRPMSTPAGPPGYAESSPVESPIPPAADGADGLPPNEQTNARSPDLPAQILAPPVLVSAVMPEYPEGYRLVVETGALTARLAIEPAQGRVLLRMLVRADGTVARVETSVSSGHPALDSAAVEAAKHWHFEPGRRDGQPIDAWVLITVRFVAP